VCSFVLFDLVSIRIRGTIALRGMGLEVGQIGNSKWTDAQNRKYLIRVLEMNQFLRAYFGPPTWVGVGAVNGGVDAAGNTIWKHPAELKGAGIIRYSECGFSDASGHIDVYDGRGNLKGEICSVVCLFVCLFCVWFCFVLFCFVCLFV
jgi:hypothetical protein